VNEESYPGLYKAASSASASSQRLFYCLVAAYLTLSLMAAAISLFVDDCELFPILLAIVFIGTIGLSILSAYKRYDRIWYNGRAVAESVKTRAWRFIMRAEPYDETDVVQATSRFVADLKLILSQNRGLGHFLDSSAAAHDAVSTSMKACRESNLEQRLQYYVKNRIDDQRGWYAKKARYNLVRSRFWFFASCASQLTALILCLFKIKYPAVKYFPVDIFIVLGGACLTWMQVKKFNDLSTSYSLTAHEISLLRADSETVDSEPRLSEFVKNSENAFSREHTQWIARKDD
jgi:hypothetical protein